MYREIYQGALAAGWQPFEFLYGEQRWLPAESLAFCHPETPFRAVVFVQATERQTVADMLDRQDHCANYGLDLCWLSPLYLLHRPQRLTCARLVEAGEQVRIGNDSPMLLAEFSEVALSDWPAFRHRLRMADRFRPRRTGLLRPVAIPAGTPQDVRHNPVLPGWQELRP
jgi:hypothetical protein